MPHSIDNSTYQESYAAFSSTAAQAATFGAVVNYGSQPFGLDAVQASLDTPLGLTNVNQDCKCAVALGLATRSFSVLQRS